MNESRLNAEARGRNVAILGAGLVGVALAKRLLKTGYSVSLSNSRGPDTLRAQEKQTGAKALHAAEAAAKADIVILAVPVGNIVSLVSTIKPVLQKHAILLDAGNYYPARDGRIKALDEGVPDTLWVSNDLADGRPVVKAFNNIIADNIYASAKSKGEAKRVALPVAGDDEKAVQATMSLVEDVGFDAYNAGSLADSWRFGPGQPAYCTEPTDFKLLSKLLARADRKQGPINRDKTRVMFDKLPVDYPATTLLRVARLSNGLDRWDVRNYTAFLALAFALLRYTVAG